MLDSANPRCPRTTDRQRQILHHDAGSSGACEPGAVRGIVAAPATLTTRRASESRVRQRAPSRPRRAYESLTLAAPRERAVPAQQGREQARECALTNDPPPHPRGHRSAPSVPGAPASFPHATGRRDSALEPRQEESLPMHRTRRLGVNERCWSRRLAWGPMSYLRPLRGPFTRRSPRPLRMPELSGDGHRRGFFAGVDAAARVWYSPASRV